MGASYVYNFETGTGTASGDAITLNKMSGKVTSSTNDLAYATTLDITVTNSRVSATSNVFITLGAGCGTVVVNKVVPGSGSFVLTVKNDSTDTACSSAISFYYLVVNGS